MVNLFPRNTHDTRNTRTTDINVHDANLSGQGQHERKTPEKSNQVDEGKILDTKTNELAGRSYPQVILLCTPHHLPSMQSAVGGGGGGGGGKYSWTGALHLDEQKKDYFYPASEIGRAWLSHVNVFATAHMPVVRIKFKKIPTVWLSCHKSRFSITALVVSPQHFLTTRQIDVPDFGGDLPKCRLNRITSVTVFAHLHILISCCGIGQVSSECALAHTALSRQDKHFVSDTVHLGLH